MIIQDIGVKSANIFGKEGEKSTSMIRLFGVIYSEQIEAAGKTWNAPLM